MDYSLYLPYLALCLILLGANIVQTVTGFGVMVLAIPALSFIFPLKILIPALVAANLGLAIYYALAERRHIDKKAFRAIAGLCLLGLPFGYLLFDHLPADTLKILLGLFVVVTAVWKLSGREPRKETPLILYYILVVVGGFVQGALACGGPFLVIYAARVVPDKTVFRATLMAVWVVIGSLLCAGYTISGAWRTEMLPIMALAVPCMSLAVVIGNRIHDRIPMRPFKIAVHVLLLLSGLLLLKPLVGYL